MNVPVRLRQRVTCSRARGCQDHGVAQQIGHSTNGPQRIALARWRTQERRRGCAGLLLCRVHEEMTKAIPASLCARLREMDCNDPPRSTPCNASRRQQPSRTCRSTAGDIGSAKDRRKNNFPKSGSLRYRTVVPPGEELLASHLAHVAGQGFRYGRPRNPGPLDLCQKRAHFQAESQRSKGPTNESVNRSCAVCMGPDRPPRGAVGIGA
jgi:hypothetical protein